jgi:hypothetical protein
MMILKLTHRVFGVMPSSLYRDVKGVAMLWNGLWWYQRCVVSYSANDDDGGVKMVNIVTTSLRIDAVAARGLAISRRKIWEMSLEGNLMINGHKVNKKSSEVAPPLSLLLC